MVRSHSEKQIQANKNHRHKKKIAAFATIAAASAVVTALSSANSQRRPLMNGIFSGEEWLFEMLRGRNERFRRMFGMNKVVFRALVQELGDLGSLGNSRYVSAEEKVAIFLRAAVSNGSNRELQERFMRGGATISVYFNQVLNSLVGKFYRKWVPFAQNQVPTQIREEPKFFPYFKDAIGAIDGSHFHAQVPADDMKRFRNRKGWISQNVLVACDFSLKFCYVLSGWEGSAGDGRIFEDARKTNLRMPEGKYLLADAGFPSCDALLIPYRGVRYHLREWEQASLRPRNPQELYNLRHAQLRNVIERIFGIAKRRFRILNSAPEYPFPTQTKLIPALAAIHNFITSMDPGDQGYKIHGAACEVWISRENAEAQVENANDDGELGSTVTAAERRQANERRDAIAQAMWDDYVAYIADTAN